MASTPKKTTAVSPPAQGHSTPDLRLSQGFAIRTARKRAVSDVGVASTTSGSPARQTSDRRHISISGPTPARKARPDLKELIPATGLSLPGDDTPYLIDKATDDRIRDHIAFLIGGNKPNLTSRTVAPVLKKALDQARNHFMLRKDSSDNRDKYWDKVASTTSLAALQGPTIRALFCRLVSYYRSHQEIPEKKRSQFLSAIAQLDAEFRKESTNEVDELLLLPLQAGGITSKASGATTTGAKASSIKTVVANKATPRTPTRRRSRTTHSRARSGSGPIPFATPPHVDGNDWVEATSLEGPDLLDSPQRLKELTENDEAFHVFEEAALTRTPQKCKSGRDGTRAILDMD